MAESSSSLSSASSESSSPKPQRKFVNLTGEPIRMPSADRRAQICILPYSQRDSGIPGTYVVEGDDYANYLPPNGYISPFPEQNASSSAQPSMVPTISRLTGHAIDPDSDAARAGSLLDQAFGDALRISPQARDVAIGLAIDIRDGKTDLNIPAELIQYTEELHAVAAALKPDVVATMMRDPANDSDQTVDPRIRLNPERTNGPKALAANTQPIVGDTAKGELTGTAADNAGQSSESSTSENGGSSSSSASSNNDDDDDDEDDDKGAPSGSALSALAHPTTPKANRATRRAAGSHAAHPKN